jgi:hypothetical protein
MTAHTLAQKLLNGADVTVCFANYLEETMISPVTNILVKHDMILLDHEDGGELSEESEAYLPKL